MDGRSPAEQLFGHTLRSMLPVKMAYFKPCWQELAFRQDKEARRQASKLQYDKTAHTLRPLTTGIQVRLQDPASKKWLDTGVIVDKIRPCNYIIKLKSGKTKIRNQRLLKPVVLLPDLIPRQEEQDIPSAQEIPSPTLPPPTTTRTNPSRQRSPPDRLSL